MPFTSASPEELRGILRESPTASVLAGFFDALGSAERVTAIRAMGRSEQRRIWEVAEGFAPLALADLVPPSRGALETVRHFGKNTLPLFTHFEKRFCRPEGADAAKPDVLYGFNFQALSPITGPGYFVARPHPTRPEILIDYTEVPGERPPAWPAVRRNEVGLARFVYGFMVDTLRRVSEHVTIGSAARRGRDIGSWFLLCREP